MFRIGVLEVGAVDFAFTAAGQVAEVTLGLQAVLGHVARIEGGVVVGRQVEVVGRGNREAGVAGRTDRGRQETGLPTVVDREIDERRVEDRNVLDPQGGIGRITQAGSGVQGDGIALDLPGVAARFAGGVGAILEADDGVVAALGVERAAAGTALVHDEFGVVDLDLAVVQLHVGLVADHQQAVVAEFDVALELAAILQLVQVGFLGLHLHAALAQDHVTGEGGDLLLLLVARGLGGDVGRGLGRGGVVVHARTLRLDIGAAAVGAGLGQLGRGQLIARDPVQVAVVGAAGLEGATLALGHQDGIVALARGGLRREALGLTLAGAGRNGRRRRLGVARPATAGSGAAAELLGGRGDEGGDRLHGEQAAGYQEGKFSAKRGGFHGHP